MTHHIRQYHLHLELNGTEADGLALQRQLAGLCTDHLLPALEQVLDRCAPPDAHLIIDWLEIDAGTLSLDRLEQDAAAIVAQAVEKILREKTAQLRIAPQLAAADMQLKTASQTIEEAFFYFLTTGQLPWAFRLPEGQRLEQAVLSAWAQMAGPAAIPGRVRELLRRALASAMVRQRLTWQFSAAFRENLLGRLWPENQRVLAVIRTVLQLAGKVFKPTLDEAVVGFEQLLWEVILAHIAGGETVNAAEVVSETWRRLPASARRQAALQAVLEQHWPNSTQEPQADGPATKDAARDAAAPRLVKHRTGPIETPEMPVGNPTEFEEVSYLDNAGLVLLHPFLPRFFEGLGLAKNDQMLQPERALCLLHFLATGQLTAPEHALALPKLLCAVPLAQPVATDLTLTAAEIDEAEVLLQAVVRHWTALRSTSADALRGTFLNRAGKLSHRPESADWLLQVEPMSYDILLDQLPWGISMIQLPWMPQLLRVEWG